MIGAYWAKWLWPLPAPLYSETPFIGIAWQVTGTGAHLPLRDWDTEPSACHCGTTALPARLALW